MKTTKNLLLVGLLISTINAKLSAQNLVTNGGFETGDLSGWSSFWNFSSAPVVISSNSAPVHTGVYAAQLSRVVAQDPHGGFHSSSTYISQNLNTEPSTSYTLSFWLYMQIDPFVVSEWTVSWDGIQVANGYTTSSGWTNVQLTVTATTAVTPIQFGFVPYELAQYDAIDLDDISVTPQLTGYNHLAAKVMNGGNVQLTYMGNAGTNYALDRTFGLVTATWMPQITNTAGTGGWVMFTNAPNPATNNFWRVRSVP